MSKIALRLEVLVDWQDLNLDLLGLDRFDSYIRGSNVELFLLHVADLAFLFHDYIEILLSLFEGR